MRLVLPRLYVILDAALLPRPEPEFAVKLAEAGVRLMQYRNKSASTRELFVSAQALAPALRERGAAFIVNDRADVAALAGDEAVVGVSTHNLEQVRVAAATSADYIAVGPVFPTASKAEPGPVVGLELVSQARRLTDKPIVAIGGITLERAPGVTEAGADCVVVISDILRASDPAQRARQYIDVLGSIENSPARARQTYG